MNKSKPCLGILWKSSLNKDPSNYSIVLDEINSCVQGCGRSSGSVDLLVVSKGQSIPEIKAILLEGQKKFGENYLQEALPKIDALGAFALEWHFIGAIQRNKTRNIAENFTWVHSVANKEIARRLSDQRPSCLGPLKVCLQVNLTGEPQKSGVSPDELVTLVEYVHSLPSIELKGLMLIPPLIEDLSLQQALFRRMRHMKDHLVDQGVYFDTLSMGMSRDFKAAIQEGATIVRIGSAIFGNRR